MFDQKIFGEKLRNHRKNLKMSQEEVADKIGISPQAVSKWENGDCLPDCYNLKLLSEIYNISLDVLLETETSKSIDQVSSKIEQLADEFIWTQAALSRYSDNQSNHRDLGDDLLKMWKGIYFIETGDHEIQKSDKERGNLRIMSDFGMKIWDDDGIVAVINNKLLKKLDAISEKDFEVMRTLCSPEAIKLLTAFPDNDYPISKDELSEKSGLDIAKLNTMLLMFTEAGVIEYVMKERSYAASGYKISGHFGIAAYFAIAALYVLSKKNYTLSEYIVNSPELK